jgi:anthranilate phosphoribosyltransferase
MWGAIFERLSSRLELDQNQIKYAMSEILSGRASEDQIKQFLIELKSKGETAREVLTLIEVMYEHATLIDIADRCVDTVGTGGDGFNTINISTTAAIVTTAAGARTIKHGNRAASSKSGAADLLEALGISINLNAAQVAESVRKIGIGFAFAPVFHPAMRFAAPARKALGVPTIFNVLGPLANPAKPKAVAVGVARPEMLELVAQVFALRGCEGFVFRGDEGLDEVSISGPTTIIQISEGRLLKAKFDLREIGFEPQSLELLEGGDPQSNANVTLGILSGEKSACRDAVLLNAAVAIAAFKGDFNIGIEQQIANGLVLAKGAIDSGRALELLQRWRELSNTLANSSL